MIYASNVLYEGNRGDSTHVRELVKNLSDFGHRVIVIACNTHRNSNYNNFDMYAINYYSDNLIKRLFISIYAFIIGVIVLIKRKPDIIYKRQSSMGEDILIAKLARCPVITEINGLVSEERGSSNKTIIHKIINNIFIYISNQSILNSDYLVAVTPNIKNVIQNELNISEKKIFIIPNGANIKLFHPYEKKFSCTELNLNEDFKYICFVGNLFHWQGVEYLLQAAPTVLTAYSNARFLIVGDGVMKNELEQLAHKLGVNDKFIFTGYVPHEKAPLYINASEICVVYKKPLKSGYSPLKLYEYMACGKPVVASRLEGFEILEQQNAGILVKPENPEELAKTLIKLLKDEKLRENMGKNGREYVVKNHSWEAIGRKVAAICENTINQ